MNLAARYFEELFTTYNLGSIQNVVNYCSSRLSFDHVNILDAIYTTEEVKVKVFDMKPDKAHGFDGVNIGFY